MERHTNTQPLSAERQIPQLFWTEACSTLVTCQDIWSLQLRLFMSSSGMSRMKEIFIVGQAAEHFKRQNNLCLARYIASFEIILQFHFLLQQKRLFILRLPTSILCCVIVFVFLFVYCVYVYLCICVFAYLYLCIFVFV